MTFHETFCLDSLLAVNPRMEHGCADTMGFLLTRAPLLLCRRYTATGTGSTMREGYIKVMHGQQRQRPFPRRNGLEWRHVIQLTTDQDKQLRK